MRRLNKGQAVSEYFIVLTVILAALVAIGFIGQMQGSFDVYFTKAAQAMTKVLTD